MQRPILVRRSGGKGRLDVLAATGALLLVGIAMLGLPSLASPSDHGAPWWSGLALAGGLFSVAGARGWRGERADRAASPADRTSEMATVLEQVSDAVLFLARDGRIRHANPRAEQVYGYSRGEMLGLRVHDLRPSELRAETDRHLDEAVAGTRSTFETVNQRRDGTRFPVEITSRQVLYRGEQVLLSMARDISDRKAAEAHVALLNRVLGTRSEVNRLIARARDEGEILQGVCSAALARGGFRMAWVGFVAADGIHVEPVTSAGDEAGYLGEIEVRADDTPLGGGPVGSAIRERRAVVVDDTATDEAFAPWRAAAQRHGYGSVAASPIHVGGGVVGALALYAGEPGVFGQEVVSLLEELAGDIGQALRALAEDRRKLETEETLQAQEEHLRKLSRAVEQSPVSVVITDAAGAIEYVNPKFSEVTGYSLAEVAGQNPRVLKSDRTPPETYAALWQALAAGQEWRGEFCNRKKSGELFWESAVISPLTDASGRTTHFIAVKEDISERKRSEASLREAQEQLLQSQKMEAIGRLAGGVAHDFNNLLGVITGYSEMVRRSLAPEDRRGAKLDQVLKAAASAAGLTRQLLAFSRKQVLQPKLLDLNVLVADLEKMLRRVIGEDVELTTVLDPALGSVMADPGQIEQVLMNLVVNARDAMPQGGRLSVRTENLAVAANAPQAGDPVPAGRYVVVTVADTGVGMDAPTLRRIFEPFFTTKAPDKGTGLGLATVYGIVTQSGGHVRVESEPGRGTRFRIYLPCVDHAVAEAAPALPTPAGGSETLLLAEDDESLREMVRETLAMLGYAVLVAGHPEDATAIAARHQGPIQLLITDVIMPALSGREVASRVRAIRPETGVLYISGYTADVIAPHGILDPDVEFLPKPFSADALARKVRQVLDLPRGRTTAAAPSAAHP